MTREEFTLMKTEIAGITQEEQDELAAYLVHLRRTK